MAKLTDFEFEFLRKTATTNGIVGAEWVRLMLAHIDELNRDIADVEYQRNTYECTAKLWMSDYDKLKEKYEPLTLVES